MMGMIKEALAEFFHDAWCGIKAALRDGFIALCKSIYHALPSFRQLVEGLYYLYYDQIWSIQGLIFIPLFCFLFRNNYKFRFFLCCAAATYTPVLIDYARGKTNEVAAYSSEKLLEVLEATQEGAQEGYDTIKEGVKDVAPALSEGASSLLEAGGSLVKNSQELLQEKLGVKEEEENFWDFSFLERWGTKKEKKEVPKMFFTLSKHYSLSILGAFAFALFLHNKTVIGKGFATSLLTVPLFFAYTDAKKFDVALTYPYLSYTKGYLVLAVFGAFTHFLWSKTQGICALLIASLALSIPLLSSKIYVYKVSKHLKAYKRSPLEEFIDFVGKKVEEFCDSNFYKNIKYALKAVLIVVSLYLLWKYLSVLREKLKGEGGSGGDKKFEEKNRDHLKTIQEEAEEEIFVMLISEQNHDRQREGRGFAMPKFIRIEEKQPWASSLLHLELLARQIGVAESAIPRFVACAKILEWAIHNGEKTRADFERFLDAKGMILLEGEALISGFGFDEGIQEDLRRMQRHQRLVARQQRRMRTRTRTAEQLREENEERHTRAVRNRQAVAEQRAAQQQRQNDHLEAVHERYGAREAAAEQRLREERQRREEAREAATQRREEALEQRREAQNRYEDRRQGMEQRQSNFRRDNDCMLAANATLDILEEEYRWSWDDERRRYYEQYVLPPLERRIRYASHDESLQREVMERLRRFRQRINRSAQQTTDDPTEATHTRENDNGRSRVQDRERITTGGRGGQRRGSRNNPLTEPSDEGIGSNTRRRWGAYSALLGQRMAKDFAPFKPNARHVHRLTKATSGVKKAFEEKKNQQWLIGQRKKNIETLTRLQDEESKDWWFPRTMKRIFRGNDVEEALEKNYRGLQQAHTQLKTARENYQKTYKKTYKKQEAKVRKSSSLKLKNGLAQKGGEVAAGCTMQYVTSAAGTFWECTIGNNDEVNREIMAIEREHNLNNRHGLDYVKGLTASVGRGMGVIGKKIYEDAPELKKTGATSLASTVGSTLGYFAGLGVGYWAGNPAIGGQIGSSLFSTGGVVATEALMEQEDPSIDAEEVAGATVGAALGSFIPIPIVGSMVGSMVGKKAVQLYNKPKKTWTDMGNSIESAIEKTKGWFSSWWK